MDERDVLASVPFGSTSMSQSRFKFRLRTLTVWWPGLLVTLADSDVDNIVTAAQAGTQWGYRLLGLVLILIPMLYMAQELTGPAVCR
jgi:Mn2+/Fe2+ NRAMP family transporter